MDSDTIIRVNNIGKCYAMWANPSARLKQPILRTVQRYLPSKPLRKHLDKKLSTYREDFHALSDINFEVRRGESLGILGRNGSGKSTLLQIIAGTLNPTTGTVEVNGRIAALLELGSGFNPEFTGIENVYFNANLLGLSNEQIDERLEDILAFADIGDFVHQPVKTYSSGMMVRLAFSVITAVEPDIIIVDEALSVGDAAFVAKCLNRIRSFIERGSTLLVVSHDIGTINKMTQKAMLLDQGRLIEYGDTQDVTLAYSSHLSDTSSTSDRFEPSPNDASIQKVVTQHSECRAEGNTYPTGGQLSIRSIIQLSKNAYPCTLIYSVYNYLGLMVLSDEHEIKEELQDSQFEACFNLEPMLLAPGKYSLSVSLKQKGEFLAWWKSAADFRILGTNLHNSLLYQKSTFSTTSIRADMNEMEVYPDDTVIASYPKSGNTWTRFLIANLLSSGKETINFHTAVKYVPDMDAHPESVKNLPRPRILKTHSAQDTEKRKAIYIVRDARDAYLSYYHYLRKRLPEDEAISEFIRRDDIPGGFWADHVESWLANKPAEFLIVRYEDLLQETATKLMEISSFLGIEASQRQLDEAIRASTFSEMKKVEQVSGRPYLNEQQKKQASTFMRKGQAGDWKYALSEEDKNFLWEREGATLLKMGYSFEA